MMNRLTSVVVPVRNRPSRLIEAVESVLAQRGCELEVIIVDDGSTDESGTVADSLAERHARVSTIHRERGGPAAARNSGVAASHGEWITFLDSDDLMPLDRIASQSAIISGYRDPVAILGRQSYSLAEGVEAPVDKRAEIAGGGTHPYTMSMFLRRETFQSSGGFDESFAVSEDLEFLMRLQRYGVTIVQRPEVWTERRFFGDNLTYDHDAVRRAIARAIRINRPQRAVVQ